MSDKVFCEDCVYFNPGDKTDFPYGMPDWLHEVCEAPQNEKDTYRAPEEKLNSTPIIINKFNDCPWFVRKEESSSSSSSSD